MTRSTPGRGRVTQTLLRYVDRDTGAISEDRVGAFGSCNAARFLSTFAQRTSEEINGLNFQKPAMESSAICVSAFTLRDPQVLEQSPIVIGSRVGEPFLKLWSAVVVDGLDLKDRGFAVRPPNRCRKPFELFSIRGIVREQVPGITQGQRAVTLQLPPDGYTQARSLSRQAEGKQQPRRGRLSRRYSHSNDCYTANTRTLAI
jgi:hypothetical protein